MCCLSATGSLLRVRAGRYYTVLHSMSAVQQSVASSLYATLLYGIPWGLRVFKCLLSECVSEPTAGGCHLCTVVRHNDCDDVSFLACPVLGCVPHLVRHTPVQHGVRWVMRSCCWLCTMKGAAPAPRNCTRALAGLALAATALLKWADHPAVWYYCGTVAQEQR